MSCVYSHNIYSSSIYFVVFPQIVSEKFPGPATICPRICVTSYKNFGHGPTSVHNILALEMIGFPIKSICGLHFGCLALKFSSRVCNLMIPVIVLISAQVQSCILHIDFDTGHFFMIIGSRRVDRSSDGKR